MNNNREHSTTTVRMLDIDRGELDEALYFNQGCCLKIISLQNECWQLETFDGVLILGMGDPFLRPEYYDALNGALNVTRKEELLLWMNTLFNTHGFGNKGSLIFRIEYTTRFLRDPNGNWRVFFPWSAYYTGGPALPHFGAQSDDMLFPSTGEKYAGFLNGEIDKLQPGE